MPYMCIHYSCSGIAVDYDHRQIYYSFQGFKQIMRLDYSGHSKGYLGSRHTTGSIFTYYKNHLYWFSREGQLTILHTNTSKCKISGDQYVEPLDMKAWKPTTLKVYHPQMPRPVANCSYKMNE